MKNINELDAEISLRDEEKFQSLSSYVDKTHAELKEEEKGKFDRLWRVYCNSMEEISRIKSDIKSSEIEITLIDKSFIKKFIYSVVLLALVRFLLLSGEWESSLLLVLYSIYLVYEKLNVSIKQSEKRSGITIQENSIHNIRLYLSFLGVYPVRYEAEYIKWNNELLGGSNDAVKEQFEKYKNLHFTYVSKALLDLVKINEAKNER